jgi:hypothetical protein
MYNKNPCFSCRPTSKSISIKLFFRTAGLFLVSFFLLLALPTHLEAGNQKVIDADVTPPTRKNALFIKRHHIHSSQAIVYVGEETFVLSVFKKAGKDTQKYIVVHDSEDAAFDAGLRAIKHGGTFIALEDHEGRPLYSYGRKKGSTHQDPNRMFYPENPYWPVAQKMAALLDAPSMKLVIALHNNKPGGNFRLDTIGTWKNITIASHADKDLRSLVWIPGSTVKPNKKTAEEISFYKKKKMNVIYEYVPGGQRGDGSMSVYYAKHGIMYRNIEVEAGIRGNRRSERKARRKQIRYLNVVRQYHGVK